MKIHSLFEVNEILKTMEDLTLVEMKSATPSSRHSKRTSPRSRGSIDNGWAVRALLADVVQLQVEVAASKKTSASLSADISEISDGSN